MSTGAYDTWFSKLTGHSVPRDWQRELAQESIFRSRLIRIPTGLGKTEGVLTAWSYHRLYRSDVAWPRRLVWCLPMRVLVEQTELVARTIFLGLPEEQRPQVCLAMGGEDAGEWFLEPERPALIIGTQDMLLSRSLNRGYASGRARWPVEFGLLSQDALWVMDEVQLMDVGLATSAQLQAYRDEDQSKGIKPCHTWWMSATLQSDWLHTVDTARSHVEWIREPCLVEPKQRKGGLWNIRKTVRVETIPRADANAFARLILERHAALEPSEHGRITLVVCNTVERACATFDALQAGGRTAGIELVHSRFRPEERERWRAFLSRDACSSNVDRIIVATQVVEAGVDISAGCLVTELAPWPSLVQRFGRCARYGGSGQVVVVQRGEDEAAAAPYRVEELESARTALNSVVGVSIMALEEYEAGLSSEERSQLYPYSPAHLLLRREYDELFDTTPDLTGADLDISRFIRSGDERDLQVFWLDVPKGVKPAPERQPQRRELCTVPFLKARDWLCGEESKSDRKPRLAKRFAGRAWVWDWIDGKWVEVQRSSLLPGRIVCVAAACGGYRVERGFDPESRAPVLVVEVPTLPPDEKALDDADNQEEAEDLSYSTWKTIACHCAEVAAVANQIAAELELPEDLRRILEVAGRWHDWGKTHPAFQNMLLCGRGDADRLRLQLWAKSDDPGSRRPRYFVDAEQRDERPGFRHEFASALAMIAVLRDYAPRHPALLGPWIDAIELLKAETLLETPTAAPPASVEELLQLSAEDFDLLVYLVASHHGKVRTALYPSPKDQEYCDGDGDGRGLPIRGVREGDTLPSVAIVPGGEPLPAVALTLEPAAIGLSPRTGISWRERTLGLLERFGPGPLAYLEAVLRAADVRASRLTTRAPALVEEILP